MTDRQRQLEDIRRVVNLRGVFKNPDNDYKKGWNDGMQVLADDIQTILKDDEKPRYCEAIATSLSERQRLVKQFKDYCTSKRIDFCPTSLLGWMDARGYLNTDAIKEALAKEKEELGDE